MVEDGRVEGFGGREPLKLGVRAGILARERSQAVENSLANFSAEILVRL